MYINSIKNCFIILLLTILCVNHTSIMDWFIEFDYSIIKISEKDLSESEKEETKKEQEDVYSYELPLIQALYIKNQFKKFGSNILYSLALLLVFKI